MAAYLIADVDVHDPAQYDEYRKQVRATIEQYGGAVLFRGALDGVFSGRADHDQIVALQFADLAAAKRWHDSPAYQSLVAIRDLGAEVSLILYQG